MKEEREYEEAGIYKKQGDGKRQRTEADDTPDRHRRGGGSRNRHYSEIQGDRRHSGLYTADGRKHSSADFQRSNSGIPGHGTALACVADDKIYVVAMRGEKPTTGYDIAIDSMTLSSDKDGNDTLTVNVLFTDPQAGASLTQAQTYPYIAAETNLEELPDKIEMKIKYAD